MNPYDRNEKYQRFIANASKAALPMEVILYVLLFMSSCFWWYGKPGTEIGLIGGILSVLMLWVYTFNKLPTLGLNCIKNNRAVYFQLPVTLIATSVFIVSLYNT